MAIPFQDRADAGRRLASALAAYADRPDVLALALPRGGVPVAHQIAGALHVPMDLILVRKLGVPGHEELAMGAIASGGVRILNREMIHRLGIAPSLVEHVTRQERQELERRARLYRGHRPPPEIRGRTAILVDDGLATGATMRAAVAAVRRAKPARIVLAIPIAAPPVCDEFRREVDEVICLQTADPFIAVGLWYDDFSPVTDRQIQDLLSPAPQPQP